MAEGGSISKTGDGQEGHDAVIISDVILGVRQSFVDSGVDMEVLEKLQQLWMSKLEASPSQGLSVADVRIHPVPGGSRKKGSGPSKAFRAEKKKEVKVEPTEPEELIVISDDSESPISDDDKEASSVSKVKSKTKKYSILQVDGPADSSDEEDGVEDDDDGDDDDDDDDDDNDPDGDEEDEGVEEEPLGSEDDISDEDASDLFDTENVVVCQYDKITRARNKWKFHLKDGIMNLNGKDYVFARANGDAEW